MSSPTEATGRIQGDQRSTLLHKEPLARVYAAEKGAPFTALHFGLKNAYSEGVIKKHIDEIEKYLKTIWPKGTKRDYEGSIQACLDDMGVPESANKIDKIEKLYEYLHLLNKEEAIREQINEIRRGYR